MQRSSRKFLLERAPHADVIPQHVKAEIFEVDKVYIKVNAEPHFMCSYKHATFIWCRIWFV